MTSKRAKSAIITVGAGRGFVMHGKLDRFVITAAHCLPFFPPCCSFSFSEERTYKNLLGHIGAEPSVWAECLFVDPIADIAVLGSPDTQGLGKQADAYPALVVSARPLSISDAPEEGPALLFSLTGEQMSCVVRHFGGALCISDAVPGIMPGMSGSPIVAPNGSAIGVCCASNSVGSADGLDLDGAGPSSEGQGQPRLTHHLPGWLLGELSRADSGGRQ
jgi:hypothetical protein